MQVRQTIKKVSATLGSTLLIGSTLGASATLADFPGMFVADDGTPTAQLVVGSQGKISDVVSAVNVASALGQATMGLEQRTEQLTASVDGGVGWSASNGQTLDTVNDNLYFGDQIDDVRQTLTGDHLDVLGETTFQTEDGTSISVEHYLRPGARQITFGVPSGVDNQDPFLYVDAPAGSSVTGSQYLYELQANFEDSLDFYDTSDGDSTPQNENVVGQDVELFGDTFQISADSFKGSNAGQLVLYGSSQETTLQTGQSQTLTLDGTDYTFEVVAVTDSQTVAFRVGGQLREKTEGSTLSLNGQTVRVDDVIQTSDSNSAGYVTFGVGSEKVTLEDQQPVMTGSEESEVEGTYVNLKGSNLGDDISTGSENPSLSSIEISVGAAESEDGYVKAGSTFQDPVFGGLTFRFGGLSPDASGDSAAVEEVSFSQSDSTTASISFTPQGGSQTSVEFFHRNTNTNSNNLADSDGNSIVAVEGHPVREDEYFTADAGGFGHLFQVTGFDVANSDTGTAEEATIDLKGQLSGSTIEVDLTETGDNTGTFQGTEVIDGQTYYFEATTADGGYFEVTWGTSAGYDDTGSGGSGVTTAFPAIETKNGGLLSLYDPGQDPSDFGTGLVAFQDSEFFIDTTSNSPEGANGFGDGDLTIRIVNDHDGTIEAVAGDGIETLGSSGRYFDEDGSGDYTAGDEVYVDGDSDNVYTGTTDQIVAGSPGSNGNSVTTANAQDSDWAIDAVDTNDGDAWDSGTDSLIIDLDSDGVYTDQADNVLAGTDTNLAAGDPLTDGGSLDSAWTGGAAGDMFYLDSSNGDAWDSTNDAVWIESSTNANTAYNSGDSDTLLAGTAPTDGTSATGNGLDGADWSTIKVYDDTGGDDWDSGNDALIEDVHAGGTYSTGSDTVVAGNTPSDDTSFTSTGSFDADWSLDSIDGDDGDSSWDSAQDAIIIDHGDRGTYSGSTDIQVNAGSDGTFDVTDGAAESNNDLNEDKYFAIDTDGSNGASTGDEIVQELDGDVIDGQTIAAFASSTKHTGSQPFDGASDDVIQDADSSGTFTSGDTIIRDVASSLNTGSGLQYWSSDSSEVSGVSGLTSMLPASDPAAVFIEEKDDTDTQESYVLGPAWDGTDSEVEVGGEDTAAAVSFSGTRSRVQLESDDNVYQSYDSFGTFVVEDTSGTGSVTVNYPDQQAPAGVAFTGAAGSLSTGGAASGTASVTYTAVTNQQIRGSMPEIAAVDSQVSQQTKQNSDLILVGGPAVNTLVADLAAQGDTWTVQEWRNQHQGEALLQLVEDAFAQGQHALIVAGYMADDTARAAEYISDYSQHRSALQGKMTYTVSGD